MNLISKMFLILTFVSILAPARVFACACCSERGDYYEHESNFSEHSSSEIGKIRPGSAVLRTDAGYPETIKGIEPLGESFSVKGSFKGKMWTFELTDDKSRISVLSLLPPVNFWEFGVDQEPLKETTTVILYKELRFSNRVQSATGFLMNGVDNTTTYKLILQGRGNACMNASDFSTYILQISGNKADYSFFGKLEIAEDVEMQKYVDTAGAKVANP